jgi:hypothetical protein
MPTPRRQVVMTLVVRRILLGLLLLVALILGIWTYAMPRNWYDTFPGFGMRWVVPTGPYNEHFVKDIGSMYLALAVLTAAALWFATSDATVRMTAAAWTTFNLLHLIYHVVMLHMYEGRDRFLVVASLVILVLVSGSLLIRSRRGPSPG